MLMTIGVVLGGGAFGIYNFRRVSELDRLVHVDTTAIAQLDAMYSEVRDIEASLRAYLATRNPRYLHFYNKSIEYVWQSVGGLYVKLEPEHLGDRVYDIEWALHEPLNVLERERQYARKTWKIRAQYFAQVGRSMAKLDQKVNETKAETQRLLTQREYEARHAERYFRWTIFFTTVLSASVMLASFLRLNRVQSMEREEAVAMNLAKNRFLANMSHEIRTPLAAVLGFSDILSNDRISADERVQCVSALRRNGQLLVKIIDDILDLSKVEAQKLEIECVDFDLHELVSDVETVMSLRASEKGVRLKFDADPALTGIFRSDPFRIKQILFNVIGNAIKFTEHGNVTVRGSRGEGDQIRFLVEDTGIGMNSGSAERLFEPFTQADSSTERTFGGTGLGLSIARQLAVALGGNVRLLKSRAGEGSIFEITISLANSGTPSKPAPRPLELIKMPEPASWKNRTILVVDDSEDNRSLVEFFLKSTGARVVQAASGEEALSMALRENLDLVLMDIQMPVKSGYDTTRELRKHGFDRPIIAFTAHAMREEVERCRASGCNGVLTKPVTRESLLANLEKFLRWPPRLDGDHGAGYQITHGRA
jgi:signal transduction histidine kinase/CheY-like chemotaxis protein